METKVSSYMHGHTYMWIGTPTTSTSKPSNLIYVCVSKDLLYHEYVTDVIILLCVRYMPTQTIRVIIY